MQTVIPVHPEVGKLSLRTAILADKLERGLLVDNNC
jgi:hypothetical protein